MALRDRVTATADKAIDEAECHIVVTLKDGRVLTRHVKHAIGSLERPMSDADLDAKFRGLSEPVLGAEATERLRAVCWRIEELGDAAEVARSAVPNL